MNERENVTKAKAIFARTCIVLTGLVLATGGVLAWMNARSEAPAAGQDPYDYETSIAKLKKIGQALQIYRAEYGFKPVAERKTYSDAGLPYALDVLAEPGHAWSLPEGRSTFTLPGALYGDSWLNFGHLYWTPAGNSFLFDLAPNLARRGESLPILADFNPGMRLEGRADAPRMQPAVVLRLDGSVEVVVWDSANKRDIYER